MDWFLYDRDLRHERINALLFVYIHRDISLDYDKIIDIYASKYPRGMLLIDPVSENEIVVTFNQDARKIYKGYIGFDIVSLNIFVLLQLHSFSLATGIRPQPSKLLIFSRFSGLKVSQWLLSSLTK